MFQPPIRVVVSFALPLAAAGAITAVSLSGRDAAPEPIESMQPEPEYRVDVIPNESVTVDDMPANGDPVEPAEDPARFSFLIEVAGQRYIPLSHDAVETSARTKLLAEDGVQIAITPLRRRELPESLATWRDREVIVGGNCHAHVVAFAQIARLTGDPGYAGDDKPWSAASVVEHGDPLIAGKLDGCTGSWARAASESPAAVGISAEAGPLVAAARVDLFAGELANQTQAEWRAAGLTGDWRTEVAITSLVARHPVTNERWVVLHAKRGGGCGDHEVNILAAYRVNDDGSVTRISAKTVELDSIEQLVDIDGDGTFEVIGTTSWGLNRTFIDLHGNWLSTLPLQFYGCPC
jgi:hypothetical protein